MYRCYVQMAAGQIEVGECKGTFTYALTFSCTVSCDSDQMTSALL